MDCKKKILDFFKENFFSEVFHYHFLLFTEMPLKLNIKKTISLNGFFFFVPTHQITQTQAD